MKRFLMLIGVAVVAAAMYVAASPASQRSSGPTLKQFNALKKQVTALNKTLKTVKSEAAAAVGIIGSCYLQDLGNGSSKFLTMMVSQKGGSSNGYMFGTQFDNATPTTALDIVFYSPQAYLQEVDPQCATTTFMRHGAMRAGIARVQQWAKSSR